MTEGVKYHWKDHDICYMKKICSKNTRLMLKTAKEQVKTKYVSG